jgi:hypothetical protein
MKPGRKARRRRPLVQRAGIFLRKEVKRYVEAEKGGEEGERREVLPRPQVSRSFVPGIREAWNRLTRADWTFSWMEMIVVSAGS